MEALSSYYFDKKSLLTDEEFENLREVSSVHVGRAGRHLDLLSSDCIASLTSQELLWNGSKVAILDSDEQRFLEATMAYARGAPILSDEDYDVLKTSLKSSSSIVTAQGPRCSIRSKKMYGDASTGERRVDGTAR